MTRKTNKEKEYEQRMYELCSHLLPAVIATYPDMSETEMVDTAAGIARSLLAELEEGV